MKEIYESHNYKGVGKGGPLIDLLGGGKGGFLVALNPVVACGVQPFADVVSARGKAEASC
jgi:hypothetical protein